MRIFVITAAIAVVVAMFALILGISANKQKEMGNEKVYQNRKLAFFVLLYIAIGIVIGMLISYIGVQNYIV